MKFEHILVMNVDGALRGMRNPMNSWDKSDSYWDGSNYIVGENDRNLAQKLIKAGSEHRKFMRQIMVSMDITAPLYWWKEFDTYKVGTTANSTSTMHKIHSKEITIDDFEIDDMFLFEKEDLNKIISVCEDYRNKYITFSKSEYEENKKIGKKYWKALIRILPESYLQTRTVTMSFENLYNIIHQRAGHKLTEWHRFIDKMKTIPFADDFLVIEQKS